MRYAKRDAPPRRPWSLWTAVVACAMLVAASVPALAHDDDDHDEGQPDRGTSMESQMNHGGAMGSGMDHGAGMGHHPGEGDAGEKAAGHSHARAARHGGVVTMTGAYHFETVFKPSEVSIYVYDHDQRPLSAKGIGGQLTLTWKNGDSSQHVLRVVQATAKDGVDFLRARGDLSGATTGEVKAVVHLTGLPAGEEPEVTYRVAFEPARTAGYACPMHPDVASLEPGTCDRCGMALAPAALLYACPMHPQVRGAAAAECPLCGMRLQLTAAGDGDDEPAAAAHHHEGDDDGDDDGDHAGDHHD